MNAIIRNKITCAWYDCGQVGDQEVAHGDIILEYCTKHVARAIAREDQRRSRGSDSGVTSRAPGRGR